MTIHTDDPSLVMLPARRSGEATEVLCDAFRDYPVMEWVLGREWPRQGGATRGEGLRQLVRFFVMARVVRKEPVLALQAPSGKLLGVATLTLPDSPPAPDQLDPFRQEVWNLLGTEARSRYEMLGRMWQTFQMPDPHHHLNMIGVRAGQAGRGVGRRLLDEVHRLVAEDPKSVGISLTTETEENVSLYRHMGYRVVGEGQVPATGPPAIRSWGMFRKG